MTFNSLIIYFLEKQTIRKNLITHSDDADADDDDDDDDDDATMITTIMMI